MEAKPEQPKFVMSKWETIDETELEAQGKTEVFFALHQRRISVDSEFERHWKWNSAQTKWRFIAQSLSLSSCHHLDLT